MTQERYQDDQGNIIGAPNGGGRALEALGYTRISDGEPPTVTVVIPDGTPTDRWTLGELKAFAARDGVDLLAELVAFLEEDDEDSDADVEIPDGEPTEKWKVGEIKAYAVRESVDLGDAKNKSEYLAAIAAAKPAE